MKVLDCYSKFMFQDFSPVLLVLLQCLRDQSFQEYLLQLNVFILVRNPKAKLADFNLLKLIIITRWATDDFHYEG
jgi:hypothetical protein